MWVGYVLGQSVGGRLLGRASISNSRCNSNVYGYFLFVSGGCVQSFLGTFALQG